jgi:maltose O-acetyltransferase
MGRALLRAAGTAATAAALSRLAPGGDGVREAIETLTRRLEWPRIEDPLLLDYLLNTFVSKIPFPEIRMDLYRRAGMTIGADTNIMMHCFVLEARGISIGPNCIIGPFTTLDGRGTLTIGRNVNIAGEVLTIGGHHLVDSPTAEGLTGKVVIEDNAWVAMRATILPGVTIHEGAYVAAAALVNRDVEPYTLVGGVPAKRIRDRSRDIQYTLRHFPNWI